MDPYRRSSTLVLAVVVTLSASSSLFAVATPEACRPLEGEPPESLNETLSVGRYSVEFVATVGSKDGARVVGTMTLRLTSRSDRSPRTGEAAEDYDITQTPLYGWLEADLRLVGALLCRPDGISGPLPDSRDPVYPGVLVHLSRWSPDSSTKFPDGAPVLTVGMNRRKVELWAEGCGIIMWIYAKRNGEFIGKWHEIGNLAQDGLGHFCLRSEARGDGIYSDVMKRFNNRMHRSGGAEILSLLSRSPEPRPVILAR